MRFVEQCKVAPHRHQHAASSLVPSKNAKATWNLLLLPQLQKEEEENAESAAPAAVIKAEEEENVESVIKALLLCKKREKMLSLLFRLLLLRRKQRWRKLLSRCSRDG